MKDETYAYVVMLLLGLLGFVIISIDFAAVDKVWEVNEQDGFALVYTDTAPSGDCSLILERPKDQWYNLGICEPCYVETLSTDDFYDIFECDISRSILEAKPTWVLHSTLEQGSGYLLTFVKMRRWKE